MEKEKNEEGELQKKKEKKTEIINENEKKEQELDQEARERIGELRLVKREQTNMKR